MCHVCPCCSQCGSQHTHRKPPGCTANQCWPVFRAEYGVKPKLEETERSSPELYDKFVRFVALQDYVRNFESQL